MAKTISDERKQLIKSFARQNSIKETMRRFDICRATAGRIAGTRKIKPKTVKEKTPDRVFFRHEDFRLV